VSEMAMLRQQSSATNAEYNCEGKWKFPSWTECRSLEEDP